LAKAAARKAIEIDDSLAEAHASLAYALLSYDWNLPEAAKEFQRAVDLNPGYATAHHWRGHYFMAAGQLDQALAEMDKAQELDPLSHVINVGVGWCYYYSRQYDRAIAAYRRTLDLEPNFPLAHYTLGLAYEQKKLYPEAIAEFQRAVTLSGGGPGAVAALGHAYAVSGERAKAQAQLARLEEMGRSRYVPALYLAGIHTALGNRDQAFLWLAKAVDERSEYLIYAKSEPTFDSLRGDPRFPAVLPLP